MATLEACFDNSLGGPPLSARQIASLAGQRVKVTHSHDFSRTFGMVTVQAAGAWDDNRIDMILEGEQRVLDELRGACPTDRRPQLSIGYATRGDDPYAVTLWEVTTVTHPATIPDENRLLDAQIDALHGDGAAAALDAAIADGTIFGALSAQDVVDSLFTEKHAAGYVTADGERVMLTRDEVTGLLRG